MASDLPARPTATTYDVESLVTGSPPGPTRSGPVA